MYKVEYKIINSRNGHESGLTGFVPASVADRFDPSWGIPMLFHDTFEHFFENSKWFATRELSWAGECVAMGFRFYHLNHCGLPYTYFPPGMFGAEHQVFYSMISGVKNSLEEYEDYAVDFMYKRLPEWNGVNEYKGVAKMYQDKYVRLKPELYEKIETAISYGYWLAERMFSGMNTVISAFCYNMDAFLKATDMGGGGRGFDPYETIDQPVDGMTLTIKVERSNIVARFSNGVLISSNMADHWRSVKQWENWEKKQWGF